VDDPDDGAYSRAPTIEDLARICRSLNEAAARYVLIGGFAVIIHGSGRTTKDIDFLVDTSRENVARLKAALSVLPDNAAGDLDDGDVEKYQVVRVADEVVVDLLAAACGVSYEDAAPEIEEVLVEGTPIPVASKRTLIRTKQTVRPSDHDDCEYLEQRLAEEQPSKS
jgi:hypothetical protein